MAVPVLREWLATPQTDLECYVDLYDGGRQTVHRGLPVTGDLTLSRTGISIRTTSATVNTPKPREVALGLAQGWTACLYVHVRQGSLYTVPLGVYRATSVEWRDDEPTVTCDLRDEMLLVEDAVYTAPYTAKRGWEAWGACELNLAVPGIPTLPTASNRAVIREDSRYGAISRTKKLDTAITTDASRTDNLAALERVLGTKVFMDATGRLTMRKLAAPYYLARPGKADYFLDRPDDDALWNAGSQKFDRSAWFNQLVIHPPSNSDKFWSVSRKVTSGDYPYGARFGAKPRVYTDDDLVTKSKAEAAIGDLVAPLTRAQHKVTLTMPPYWWIEPGTVIALPPGKAGDPVPRYVIDSISLPVGLGDMTLETTSLETFFYAGKDGNWDV